MEPTAHHTCHVVEAGRVQAAERDLLVEEPLLIQQGDTPLVTLMRTPGHEIELAIGYLLTEGLIGAMSDLGAVSFCSAEGGQPNVVRVTPAAGRALAAPDRYRAIFSSCSLCGKEALDELAREVPAFERDPGRLTALGIAEMGRVMRERQAWFRATGASHAAGLALRPLDHASLDATIVREDIGRHNALDKAAGAALARGMDLRRGVLFLSGRLSLEMVAKAARAGIRDVAGVSAPTSLAVDLARRLGMFVAGFARGESFTIYAGAEALREDL